MSVSWGVWERLPPSPTEFRRLARESVPTERVKQTYNNCTWPQKVTSHRENLLSKHHCANTSNKNKLKCCEFKGKQAYKIESTSLCCRSYSVLHVIYLKNEWSVCVE